LLPNTVYPYIHKSEADLKSKTVLSKEEATNQLCTEALQSSLATGSSYMDTKTEDIGDFGEK